jgi:hypothetical protein
MDPQSWPAEPQDYKQECTEHAFTGVNSKSALCADETGREQGDLSISFSFSNKAFDDKIY